MTDVYLYGGEPAPNDVRLRDPTAPPPPGGTAVYMTSSFVWGPLSLLFCAVLLGVLLEWSGKAVY